MERPVVGVSNFVIRDITLFNCSKLNGSHIYQEIVETFGKNIITEQKVQKWRFR